MLLYCSVLLVQSGSWSQLVKGVWLQRLRVGLGTDLLLIFALTTGAVCLVLDLNYYLELGFTRTALVSPPQQSSSDL